MSSIIPSSGGNPQATYLSSPLFQNLSTSVRDTLVNTFTIDELNTKFPVSTTTPSLQSPETLAGVSLFQLFQSLGNATLSLQKELQAAEYEDQMSRKKLTLNFTDQNTLITALENQISEIYANQVINTANAMNSIQNLALQMSSETQAMNDLGHNVPIVTPNNTTYNSLYDAWIAQPQELSNFQIKYDQFISNIQSLPGVTATPVGSGFFQFYDISVPADQTDAYNAYAAAYTIQVNDQNDRWTPFYNLAQYYNDQESAYILQAQSNTSNLHDQFSLYHIETYEQLINPQPINYQQIPLIGMPSAFPAPTPLANTGSSHNFNFSKLPLLLTQITQTAPQDLSQIGNFPYSSITINNVNYNSFPTNLSDPNSFVYQDMSQIVYDYFHAQDVDSINLIKILEDALNAISFKIFGSAQVNQRFLDSIKDPLLNTKPIALKVIPGTIKSPTTPAKTPISSNVNSLNVQTTGLGNPNIQGIIGKAMYLKSLNESNLIMNENQQNAIANELTMLSESRLNKTGIESLLPALSLIMTQLPILPQNSPSIALLYSVSYANRIQEAVNNGVTAEDMNTYLAASPELKNLTPEDVQKLMASQNLGLLLTSLKLLFENLGLGNLLMNILLPMLPTETANNALLASTQETNTVIDELGRKITDYFKNQGLSLAQSQFLAEFGTNLLPRSLAPTVTSISRETMDRQTLIDSIKANLIASSPKVYTTEKADLIANEAVDRTFDESKTPLNETQFKNQLSMNLIDLNVRSSLAYNVTNEAITIPPIVLPPKNSFDAAGIPITLVATVVPETSPQLAPSPSIVTSSTGLASLSQAELIAILEKRATELLVPQLGIQLSKVITDQLITALYGTPNPDQKDVSGIKSPFSLINSIKNQVDHLIKNNNQEQAVAVSKSFKDTIKTTTDFYPFSLKLMDPAYAFIYSSGAGMMYAGHEPSNWKKSVDIIV